MNTDYLIIGAGIIGLSVARKLKDKYPDAKICVLDKEEDTAYHASGRNSGVLHAGFYYSADSLKARFTVTGNRAWKEYCRAKDLPLNECGKLVVARDRHELGQLDELYKRGLRNGSTVHLIDQKEAEELEPNVRTFKRALYSPGTASVDPGAVCRRLKEDLREEGVTFSFLTEYRGRKKKGVTTSRGGFTAKTLINCAGLYADKIAKDFGFSRKYTIIPFKGLYLKYTKNKTGVGMNIYPVPNLKNPFLGVHFTKTVDDSIKIGPTAIPAFWRENYSGFKHFRLNELAAIGYHETKLFLTNAFHFRSLAFEELRKYSRTYFVGLATKMVKDIDPAGFTEYTAPGIQAQLLDKTTSKLLQDFVIEGDRHSIHILNAVSPAFTCALPFANFVVEQYLS